MNIGRRRTQSTSIVGERWKTVAKPDSAFDFVPFSIQKKGRTFRVDPSWDISVQIARTGGVKYVAKTGNDTTGDGTQSNPYLTIGRAFVVLGSTQNAVIYVGAGRYGWSDGGFQDGLWTVNNRSLVAYGAGDVVIDAYLSGGAYSLVSGQTNTYQSAQANPIDSVLDYGTLDSNGDPTAYGLQTSIITVEANEGSYWWDDPNNILYIHALGHGSPSVDIRPQYSGLRCPRIAVNDISMYWEGVKCYHLKPTIASSAVNNTGIVYFKNCRFMHQNLSGTIGINGYTAYFQGCQYAHNKTDALTGNVGTGGNLAKIVEIDCEGWDGGTSASNTINATTNHGAGINVIVNGDYYNTYGAPVGFIQNGKAWLLGTNSHDCYLGSGTNDVNYLLQESAWLDNCTGSGSTYDFSVDTGNTIYTRNFVGAGNNSGAGTISSY